MIQPAAEDQQPIPEDFGSIVNRLVCCPNGGAPGVIRFFNTAKAERVGSLRHLDSGRGLYFIRMWRFGNEHGSTRHATKIPALRSDYDHSAFRVRQAFPQHGCRFPGGFFVAAKVHDEELNLRKLLATVASITKQDAAKGGGQEDGAYWEDSKDQLLRNLIELVKLARGRITVGELYAVLSSSLFSPHAEGRGPTKPG